MAVTVVIDADDRASKKVKKTSGSLKKFLGTTQANLLKLGVATAGAAVATKKLFDGFERGAKVLRAEESFRTLAADADGLLTSLQRAADGTVSAMGLMGTANRALALGIEEDNIPELFEVSRKAARAMGLDSETAFSDLATGIARRSPLILDNLGFITKGLKDGATQADLMALVMKQAGEKFGKFNSKAKDAAYTLAESKALWEDLGDAASIAITEVLLPGLTSANTKLSFFVSALKEAVKRFIGPTDEIGAFNQEMEKSEQRIRDLERIIKTNTQSLAIWGEQAKQGRLSIFLFGDRQEEAKKAIAGATIELNKEKAALDKLSEGLGKASFAEANRVEKAKAAAKEAAKLRRQQAAQTELDAQKQKLAIGAVDSPIARLVLETDMQLAEFERRFQGLQGFEEAKNNLRITKARELAEAIEQESAREVAAEKAKKEAKLAEINAGVQASLNAFKILGASNKALAAIQIPIEIARGIQAIAAGTWPPNPLALLAASKHFLAAKQFAKVAKGGGGGAGAGGGRGAGGLGAGTGIGAGQQQRDRIRNIEVKLVVGDEGVETIGEAFEANTAANARFV